MIRNLDELLSNIHGLEPNACLVLGSGFVREEWKTLCFKRGYSLIGTSIQNVRQIASQLVPESNKRVLEAQARVELLRQAFKSEELRSALPLLSRNRSRPSYFEKLDQILQQGRMNFAHSEEAEVIASQLVDKTGNLQKREEFFLLNRYWQRLLEVRELWDEARLYETAVEKLSSGQEKLFPFYYRIEHMREKPRVEWFWSELAKHTQIESVPSQKIIKELYPLLHPGEGLCFTRKRAHSIEDAANFLIDDMVEDLEHRIVVIQDTPLVRRTLKRVAAQRGVSLLDPRDPTLVTQSEALKLAMLDLELCAKGFSRSSALEWLRNFQQQSGEVRKKIIDGAIIQGLESYQRVPSVYFSFQKVSERYPSRLTIEKLEEAMIESIRVHDLPVWTSQVLERLFQEWRTSLEQIDLQRMKKPLRFWFEQLQNRLKQASPVLDPTKNRKGLRLYRVDQCPSLLLHAENAKVHFFGIENSFFESKETQGEWFSVRDQEILSIEFGWQSSSEKSDQNRSSFDLWNLNEGTVFWEFEYDEKGSETEGYDFILGDTEKFPIQLVGAHPRLLSSWTGATFKSAEVEGLNIPVKDPSMKEAWPFSFLNSYGNCPFTAYAQNLLRLQDERDVEVELAADRFGTLLHVALDEIVKTPELSIEQAFETAWDKTPATAWERNDRWYQATRTHVLAILKEFVADEAEYRARSKTSLFGTEKEIEIEISGMPLRGRIDRIDQHDDGLVVMDYKTGSGSIDGQKTIEIGKNLQLGLYALAVRKLFEQEVITAQYVRLDESKINRNAGFLFGAWNKGKKADVVEKPISTARSNIKSLFLAEPSDVWAQVQAKVDQLANSIRAGDFSARPADPQDCAQCRYRNVCGEARR
jgi:RecB family exonuclease